MATLKHNQFQCCFENWITQQQQDLEELLCALNVNPDNEKLHFLVEKSIKHLQEYHENRALLALRDAPSFFSPSWCTPFENCFLWIGGCRPSLSIRLVYSHCEAEFDAQLTKFLQGERKENLGEITAHQLSLINSLHCKTVREEDKLSTEMASLQENIADEPLAMVAKVSNQLGESSQDVDQVMDTHVLAMAKILSDADKLRLNTLKELVMNILTPLQAVDLLVATKKLHLSMHEWGKRREQKMGRT